MALCPHGYTGTAICLICQQIASANIAKPIPKYRGASINLDKVQRRLQTALARDSERLLELAQREMLGKIEADKLCNYMKLIKILKQMEEAEGNKLSEEELEDIAKKDSSETDET
jgi:hypothetical protein